MPFTVEVVESHKQGLTTRQKKQWVAIANQVMRKCKEDGKEETVCIASAIRQANGVVGNAAIYSSHKQTQENYTVREETLRGKKHYVVPVVMMVQGVHHGSQGPLLHQISELGKFPDSWNGIPVVIDHPEIDGVPVSANLPSIIDSRVVGAVFNTHVENNKLVAEAWLEETALQNISPDVLSALQNNQIVEVSIGVFTDKKEEAGEFEGENYEAVAINHRPDHLALLPGGTGACSVADGCGTRSDYSDNKQEGGNNVNEERLSNFKALREDGFCVNEILNHISGGMQERLDMLRRKVDSLDTHDSIHFLHEAYDDYVIYESKLQIGGTKLIKQTYQINNGQVEFTGNPTEVSRKVEYIPVSQNNNSFKRTNFKNKEVQMETNEKCTPCIKKKVDALIANKAATFSEDDREWLEGLDENKLDKLVPAAPAVEANAQAPIQALSAEDQAALNYGKRVLAEHRTTLINGIQANTEKGLWEEAELTAMSDANLEKLFKSVKKEEAIDANYALNSNFSKPRGTTITEEPLYPTGIVIE